MALYIGDELIAGDVEGQKINNPFSLFDFRFSDQILNNTSWLRADTFSWASGAVYVSAYEHLVADITGITAETENIGNHTVTFYRAADGHKICLADQETIVNDIFTTTGVAWYYILDTTNQRFKLPRTKYGFVGVRDNVGNYVPESLPNITGKVHNGAVNQQSYSWAMNGEGAFFNNYTSTQSRATTAGSQVNCGVDFDASRSSSTYQDNAPVQERATQMYLYFYVGETVQNANIIAAASVLTDIADLKARSIIETYVNGTSWYRVYSDGWCEQGGRATVPQGANIDITFLIPYANTDYYVNGNQTYNWAINPGGYVNAIFGMPRTDGFSMRASTGPLGSIWMACGYIS